MYFSLEDCMISMKYPMKFRLTSASDARKYCKDRIGSVRGLRLDSAELAELKSAFLGGSTHACFDKEAKKIQKEEKKE